MATVWHLHCLYHHEIKGKPVADGNIHVSVSSLDPATIANTIHVTAGRSYPGATFVLDSWKILGDSLTE